MFYRFLYLLLIIFGIFFITPNSAFTVYIPLELNSWGTIKNKGWNGSTPLSLPLKIGAQYRITLHLPDQISYPLIKQITNDFENHEHYIFYLENTNIFQNISDFHLEIEDLTKKWPFNKKKSRLTYKILTPKLSLISSSPSVTHGGSGLVVVESEIKSNLSMLAFMDEKNIPFYPYSFQRDGYYVILFPWYTDYSNKWSNQYILAIDIYGNTNRLSLDSIPSITRKYRQSTINLPADYAKQKATELSVSKEKAKELEGNIAAINQLLASQRTFERWNKTRTSFKESVQKIVTQSSLFSSPALPMKNAVTTATYGDRRKYYYQKKLVRTSIHRGLDYASVKNAPIYALLDGKVIYADWYSGNGKSIVIDHNFGTYSLYAHNSELLVPEGKRVKAGEQIAISGTTGQSTGDHLHLSVFIQGLFVEPSEWTNKKSINRLFHQPLLEATQYIREKNPSI